MILCIRSIIYDGLVEKLSDQKLSVRQANMKVISKLMHILRPRVVLDRFLSTLTSSATNSRTKEEIVNAVLFVRPLVPQQFQ